MSFSLEKFLQHTVMHLLQTYSLQLNAQSLCSSCIANITSNSSTVISLKTLPSGAYVLQIQSTLGKQSTRVIKALSWIKRNAP